MNKNIEKMRVSLKTYHQKALETEKKIAQMRKELLPEVADGRIKAAQAELENLKLNTIDQISAAADEGRKEVSEWYKINSADIDQADSALLRSGIRLTQQEIDELCIKHKNNGTMTRVIADYIDQRNHEAGRDMSRMVFSPYLETPDRKNQVWDKLEHTADGIIARISSGRGFASGADDPFVISSVETFGQNLES